MTILFLLLLVVAAVILQRRSIRDPFSGIEYGVRVSKPLVEPEEEFKVISEVKSTRRLPVFYLRLDEKVPDKLVIKSGTSTQREMTKELLEEELVTLRQTVYLMPRQKVTRTLVCSLPSRGRYIFRSSELCIGDLLGIEESRRSFPYITEVVVFPRRIESSAIEAAFGNYLGDISVRRFILTDPILTVGYREYSGREPQKDISWPASLRQGKLMVKQYDHTSELSANVMLNIDGGSPEEIEQAYSLARFVCESLEKRRVSYSFATNAGTANAAGVWTYMGSGLGEPHLRAILEGLGRATHDRVRSFSALISSLSRGPETAKAYVLVTTPLSPAQDALVSRVEARLGTQIFRITAEAPSAAEEKDGKEEAEEAVKEAA